MDKMTIVVGPPDQVGLLAWRPPPYLLPTYFHPDGTPKDKEQKVASKLIRDFLMVLIASEIDPHVRETMIGHLDAMMADVSLSGLAFASTANGPA